MLIGEIISRVRNDNKLVGADVRLSDRAIFNKIKTKRDYFIKMEDDKKKLLNHIQIFTPLHEVELMDVPSVEALGFDIGRMVKRSKNKIPKIVMAGYGPIIRRVSSLDGSELIHQTTENSYSRKVKLDTHKYDNTLYFFMKNGYMYLPNVVWPSISMEAYFEDELEIEGLNNCETDICYAMQDREFLVPAYLNEVIAEKTAEEIARYYLRVPDKVEVDKNPNQ
jgi:hypothetical protein